jgi:hypothetical protein
MRVVALLAAALLLTACATTPPPEPKKSATMQDAATAIQSAQQARDKADAVGHEWRDTGAMIGDAQKALGAQQYDEAVKLANEARRQAELAYRQYEIESQKKPVAR